MDYASVLKSGLPSKGYGTVTPHQPPPPPVMQQQPQPLVEEAYPEEEQPPQPLTEDIEVPPPDAGGVVIGGDVVVEEETEGVGVEVLEEKELVGIENTGMFKKIFQSLTPENDERFWNLFVVTAGPKGFCNLGVSSKYFYGKFWSTSSYWELVEDQAPVPAEPLIKFYVDVSTPEGQAPAITEKVQTVPLVQVKTEFQKRQLAEYWFRTVKKAFQERNEAAASAAEESKKENKEETGWSFRKSEINTVLHGGFGIETVHPKQKLVQLRELRQVYVWLKAIDEHLLSRKKLDEMTVTIPYNQGTVTLTRVGRGGTYLSIKVHQGKETVSALFSIDSFMFGLYSVVAEEYLSVLLFCRNSFFKEGQRVASNTAEFWKPIEDYVLTHATAFEDLSRVLLNVKDKLARCRVIPRSTLPDAFRRLQSLHQKRKDDEASTNDNISDFVYENLPQFWEETKRATQHLAFVAKQQRDREYNDRIARIREKQLLRQKLREEEEAERAAHEAAMLEAEEKKKKKDAPKVKPKTKTVKVTDKEGFILFKNVKEGEEANVEETSTTVPEPVQAPKKKKTGPVNVAFNPFTPVLQEASFPTIAEVNARRSITKAQRHEQPKQATPSTTPTASPESKKTSEPAKKTAESAKKTAESAKKTAESAKKTVEPAKKTAEPAKKTAEPAKKTAATPVVAPPDKTTNKKAPPPPAKKPTATPVVSPPDKTTNKKAPPPAKKPTATPVVSQPDKTTNKKAPPPAKKPTATPVVAPPDKTTNKKAPPPPPAKKPGKTTEKPAPAKGGTPKTVPEAAAGAKKQKQKHEVEEPKPNIPKPKKGSGGGAVAFYKQSWFQPIAIITVLVIVFALGYMLFFS